MARQRRRVVTRYHQEVDVSIIPQVNERRTLTTRIVTPVLLFKTIQFGMGSSPPTVPMGGSSMATSFPLQQKKLSPSAGDMVDELSNKGKGKEILGR